MNLYGFSSKLRDILLDSHESAEAARDHVAAVPFEAMTVTDLQRLRELFLQRMTNHAGEIMALANSMDVLAEVAGQDTEL